MIYWRFARNYLLHVNVATLEALDTIRHGRTMNLQNGRESRLPMRRTDWQLCLKETLVCLDGDAKDILRAALDERVK